MKISMYELLGMVKDGKAPKKVKVNKIIYEYQGDDYLYKDEDKKEYWLFSDGYTKFNEWLENFLNMEVEILEEEKKIPEKLPIYDCTDAYSKFDINDNRKAINEIIDYLKSKGE